METTDKIIIVDLEATCWEGDGDYQKKNSEIIEIGACILDRTTGANAQSIGILIKPQKSEVSAFCTSLTTITKQMLDRDGMSLDEGCDILVKDYNSKGHTWASYGNYDRSF